MLKKNIEYFVLSESDNQHNLFLCKLKKEMKQLFTKVALKTAVKLQLAAKVCFCVQQFSSGVSIY